MFSKYSLSLFVASVFVFGLFILSLPQTASAGFGFPVAAGCCITNGGQCSPSCGPETSSCQNDGTSTGQCDGVLNPGDGICGGPNKERVDCYIEGDFCVQIANNRGQCGPPATATPTPTATPAPICVVDADCDDGEVCTTDTCNLVQVCESVFDEANDPSCAPAAISIIPTMGQWGMIIATILLGFFAVRMLRNRKDSEI